MPVAETGSVLPSFTRRGDVVGVSYVTVEPSLTAKVALHGIMEAELEALGVAAEARAKRLAPVRTGVLRDSIYHEIVKGPVPQLIIGAHAPYAAYVELGTVNMAAEPFLAPAVSG